VRAAIEAIADLGFDKASFAKITQRAGLRSPRMISYHFADKDDLIHQVLVEIFTAGATFITERMAETGTAPDRLRGVSRA
jgi:AcrR family transcriptional regulator